MGTRIVHSLVCEPLRSMGQDSSAVHRWFTLNNYGENFEAELVKFFDDNCKYLI